MTQLDRLLEDQLGRHAERLSLPPGDLPAVMARSRRRRQHRAMAAGTAMAVAAATVTSLALNRGGGSSRQVSVGVAATNPPVRQGDAGIRWQRSDAHAALGYAYSVSSAGSLYAISTAPGVAPPSGPASALYSSSDGVNWTLETGPSGISLADLAAVGNRLYVVGTGSATAVIATPKVGYTDDKSGTWHQTALPIDTGAITTKASTVDGEVIKIAAGPKGVVAVAVISAVLDVPRLLSAGVTAPHGWALSATGVDLLGAGPACPVGTALIKPGSLAAAQKARAAVAATPIESTTPSQVSPTACFPSNGGSYTMVKPQTARGVIGSYTWAQLGVTGDLLRAVQGEPFVFFSTDGTTFKRVALPVTISSTALVHVAADASGYALLAEDSSGLATVFHSPDGSVWQQDPALPGGFSDVTAVGRLGGRTVVVGNTTSGDPTAVAAQGSGAGGSTVAPVFATLDGGSWAVSSLRGVLSSPAANPKTMAEAAAIGPLGVAVVVSGASTPDVLFSQDGTTWSDQPLGPFVTSGVDTSAASVVVTANRAVVTLQLANPQQTGPAPEVVVVGTPTG
jgi:hypothetical protein